MYQDTSKDERYQIDSFISDDKKHFVEWKFSKELGYPTWICKTHDKPYYRDCVTSSEVSEGDLLH